MMIKRHIQFYKSKIIVLGLLLLISIGMFIIPQVCHAELTAMSDKQLGNITGRQGFSEFTIDGNTARIFFDMHIETYMEINSMKLGYYTKSDDGVGTSNSLNTAKYSALGLKSYNDSYAYVREYGTTGPNLFTGPQGDGKNMNFTDWDINWENVKLGKSEAEPMIINGLIMKVEFDDINSANKKLKRVVVGSNDVRGQMSADMKRTTGIFNPLTTTDSQARAQGSTTPSSGNPILLKRDGFNKNWDNYVLNSGDNDTGFWIVLNFGTGPSGETDHIGWEVISGYDERAIDFSYKTGIENVDLSGY